MLHVSLLSAYLNSPSFSPPIFPLLRCVPTRQKTRVFSWHARLSIAVDRILWWLCLHHTGVLSSCCHYSLRSIDHFIKVYCWHDASHGGTKHGGLMFMNMHNFRHPVPKYQWSAKSPARTSLLLFSNKIVVNMQRPILCRVSVTHRRKIRQYL